MKKKQITTKLSLRKETLRDLTERDMSAAAGGATALCTNYCEPTGATDCYQCGPRTNLSGGSCPSGAFCCY